ncbi:MAG TPA: DUF222 domain-containing protein [Trebonia sp.]|nr:DUF222 domain-containing protein [Trebonia sp.]
MGWQPGSDAGKGPSPDRDPAPPGGTPPVRDPRLADFASDSGRGAIPPSGRLALIADEISGPERRCPGATDDELAGLLRSWAAIESWASGAKLAVIAEMIRRDGAPRHGGYHGDLPDEWSPSLRHELAGALACSVQSAETAAWLAWEQQARLPGTGALLDNGTLTYGKARAIIETFKYLTDADAARAEALILDQLAGKTYTQVLRLAEQAALTVDPELATRRREQAQKRDARVTLFRELSGTAGLSGRDLPPDEALAAMARVNARAQEYEDSGSFGDAGMDALRAYAYLDLLKGTPAEVRIACAEAQDETAETAEALAWAEARAARAKAQSAAEAEPEAPAGAGTPPASDANTPDIPNARDDDEEPDDDGGADDGRDDGGPGHGGPGGPSGPTPEPGAPSAGRELQPRPPDLVVPLLTLLGLAERPGEIQGFGLLDPALARDMAATAAGSPRTEVCVTVTSPEGYAIGHGCTRPVRSARPSETSASPGAFPGASPAGVPARLNLTVPATALATIADGAGPWAFVPHGGASPPSGADPPGGHGSWMLTLPDGRRFTVRLELVPTFACDHRYETHGYRPSAKLRHLVQVRDGTCTFPPCNRHARESDFEHAQPYDKGGKSCACNAGARSRACHRIKQSPGWNITQPRPGWHRWQTPAGRVYTKEPKRYPA